MKRFVWCIDMYSGSDDHTSHTFRKVACMKKVRFQNHLHLCLFCVQIFGYSYVHYVLVYLDKTFEYVRINLYYRPSLQSIVRCPRRTSRRSVALTTQTRSVTFLSAQSVRELRTKSWRSCRQMKLPWRHTASQMRRRLFQRSSLMSCNTLQTWQKRLTWWSALASRMDWIAWHFTCSTPSCHFQSTTARRSLPRQGKDLVWSWGPLIQLILTGRGRLWDIFTGRPSAAVEDSQDHHRQKQRPMTLIVHMCACVYVYLHSKSITLFEVEMCLAFAICKWQARWNAMR